MNTYDTRLSASAFSRNLEDIGQVCRAFGVSAAELATQLHLIRSLTCSAWMSMLRYRARALSPTQRALRFVAQRARRIRATSLYGSR